MKRRTYLSLVGGTTVSIAGCVGDTRRGTGSETTSPGSEPSDQTSPATTRPPNECPTTMDLGVTWPQELDRSAVESFVEEYEHVYYRDVVVEYKPESELDSYDLSGSVSEGPTSVGNGWELKYSGGGGVYRPTLFIEAMESDAPEDAHPVPLDEVEDDRLRAVIEEAAQTGEAELHIDKPGEEVDRYVDLLAALSPDFEHLSGRGDSDTLYIATDGSTVELTATASNFHGDYWWTAWYYVDERVVRRTADEDTDPQDGRLLECRDPD